MTVQQAIEKRQSIRNYLDKAVPTELVNQVLEAGRKAPSARNGQKWQFVCVSSEQNKQHVIEACMQQQCTKTAPMFIVVCATSDGLMLCNQSHATIDCSIALSFMMLQATELGLGTVWLGHFDADKLKQLLNLPAEYIPVAVTPLGYPNEQKDNSPRKSLSEITTFM